MSGSAWAKPAKSSAATIASAGRRVGEHSMGVSLAGFHEKAVAAARIPGQEGSRNERAACGHLLVTVPLLYWPRPPRTMMPPLFRAAVPAQDPRSLFQKKAL